MRTVKAFEEEFGSHIARRIAALEPGHYPRAGAAIPARQRHGRAVDRASADGRTGHNGHVSYAQSRRGANAPTARLGLNGRYLFNRLPAATKEYGS